MSDVFEFVLAGHHVSSKIKQIASAICAEAHIEGTSTERSEETYETTRLSVFISCSRSPPQPGGETERAKNPDG